MYTDNAHSNQRECEGWPKEVEIIKEMMILDERNEEAERERKKEEEKGPTYTTSLHLKESW